MSDAAESALPTTGLLKGLWREIIEGEQWQAQLGWLTAFITQKGLKHLADQP